MNACCSEQTSPFVNVILVFENVEGAPDSDSPAMESSVDLEVIIEGVSDVRVTKEITRKVRQMCKRANCSGQWSVEVSPSETRGQWDLGVRGPFGRHFASLSAGVDQLPKWVAEQLQACLSPDGMTSPHNAAPVGRGASHTARAMSVVGVAAVASLAWTAVTFTQPRVSPQAAAMADFSHRVTAYLDLTKKATAGVPQLKRTDDPSEIASRERALGNAIRAGRAGAQPGDIFTTEIARSFRRVIKNDFRRRPRQGQKVVLDEIPHFHPKVNQTYPSEWPLATFPPTLLAALPELPDELEYRLLSEALILRDVKANIIVDFILDVF
jgi:hypothetical protein